MKTNSTVRSPKLAGSAVRSSKVAEMSLGDTLRKAKKDLFFTRCVYGILFIFIAAAIFALFYFGYIDMLIDWFYSLM